MSLPEAVHSWTEEGGIGCQTCEVSFGISPSFVYQDLELRVILTTGLPVVREGRSQG